MNGVELAGKLDGTSSMARSRRLAASVGLKVPIDQIWIVIAAAGDQLSPPPIVRYYYGIFSNEFALDEGTSELG